MNLQSAMVVSDWTCWHATISVCSSW